MTKDMMRKIAAIYGFEEWATLGGKDLQFMNEEGINLILYEENNDFKLMFKVPQSLSVLVLSAGSADNLSFFVRNLNKFKAEVSRLTKGELYGNFN